MIKVQAVGNLGKDAEIKQINSELSVVNFSIASNRKTKDGKETIWLNCNKFKADNLAPFLKKGTKVFVSGDLEIRKVEDKYYTSVNVRDLEFCGGEKSESEYSGAKVDGESQAYQSKTEVNDMPF